ncbi:ras-like protein family member 10B [Lycorma delicatula]|uniref:ras-like protein family member 10B n=1 Tax=Lycorma delicatula TaxID=130591 RepID=UPI003F517A63
MMCVCAIVSLSATNVYELDLDYLERRAGTRLDRSALSLPETSPDSMDLVKVILLGAPGVGKTSIIQQFVWNDFSEEYVSTDRKHTYYPSVIINDRLYELKISDLPAIPYFPVNSFYEWTEFRFYGLRSATAYVLVFDLSNTDTFQYIRTLRDQIAESRDIRNVPLLVVGNKQDLLVSAGSSATNCRGNNNRRRDIMNLVKKHWKCGYVECSARYNWRVVAVFKELMKTIDSMESAGGGTQGHKEVCSPMIDNIHEALDRNKCSIL